MCTLLYLPLQFSKLPENNLFKEEWKAIMHTTTRNSSLKYIIDEELTHSLETKIQCVSFYQFLSTRIMTEQKNENKQGKMMELLQAKCKR